jgi:hypothetical protein
VLLALWMYRKLPAAAGPPRPVPVVHRVTGFALFALTVPVAEGAARAQQAAARLGAAGGGRDARDRHRQGSENFFAYKCEQEPILARFVLLWRGLRS